MSKVVSRGLVYILTLLGEQKIGMQFAVKWKKKEQDLVLCDR